MIILDMMDLHLIIQSIPDGSTYPHIYQSREYLSLGVTLCQVVVDHMEPLPHLLHNLLTPLRVRLQLVNELMVPVQRVSQILLSHLHTSIRTWSVSEPLAKKLELVLLASTTR